MDSGTQTKIQKFQTLLLNYKVLLGFAVFSLLSNVMLHGLAEQKLTWFSGAMSVFFSIMIVSMVVSPRFTHSQRLSLLMAYVLSEAIPAVMYGDPLHAIQASSILLMSCFYFQIMNAWVRKIDRRLSWLFMKPVIIPLKGLDSKALRMLEGVFHSCGGNYLTNGNYHRKPAMAVNRFDYLCISRFGTMSLYKHGALPAHTKKYFMFNSVGEAIGW